MIWRGILTGPARKPASNQDQPTVANCIEIKGRPYWKPMRLVHESVEDCVGERGVLQPRMPMFKRQLRGDDCRA